MKKNTRFLRPVFFQIALLVITIIIISAGNNVISAANVQPPQSVTVPALAYDDTNITLTWEKPTDYSNVANYDIYRNGTLVGNTSKLFYIVKGLTPNTSYKFTIRAKDASGSASVDSNTVIQATNSTPTVYNILNYGAKGDGSTKDTIAIQNAINACSPGGKVLIPAGQTFISGALNLKSNMILEIDGVLKGSDSIADYPFTSKRFPYYETTNYMGLLNAYTTNYGSITNVTICGTGSISGGNGGSGSLTILGDAEQRAHGDTARGDLITVKGVTNFYLGSGLTLTNPAMHTIFISNSKNVTVSGITASTYNLHNSDGIDLATSDTAWIFNSTFDNGDDCINLNAGVGSGGVAENYPDNNIRIFNCTTKRGHGGVVFGSFTAAWIQNVTVEDCQFNGTNIGLRFKTGSTQGGGARHVIVRDISMQNIVAQAIFLDSSYSSSYPSSGPGYFQDITISNITVQGSKKQGLYISGLASKPHNNLTFNNINLLNTSEAMLNYCNDSSFTGVNLNGETWNISNSTGNVFTNCQPMPK
jgi:exo-poly-alpha-galacturonosidase